MINSDHPSELPAPDDHAIARIVAAGPRGALMLTAIATACVVAIWLAFYLFVFLPRGALQ
jgi:hypothetical protein